MIFLIPLLVTGLRLIFHYVPSSDQSISVITQSDPLITSNSFSSTGTEEGVILGDVRGARLAIESDISIADFPTVASCLLNLQSLPAEFNNGL